MTILNNGLLDFAPAHSHPRPARKAKTPDRASHHKNGHAPHSRSQDAEFLRHVAWQVGENRAVEAFRPGANHVGLGMITPQQAFAHWRILDEWVEQTARRKGAS